MGAGGSTTKNGQMGNNDSKETAGGANDNGHTSPTGETAAKVCMYVCMDGWLFAEFVFRVVFVMHTMFRFSLLILFLVFRLSVCFHFALLVVLLHTTRTRRKL